MNRRVWKWVQVLQGYDCDIVHIAKKSNLADHLSRRSIKELKSMVDVRHTEESMVQKLRLGEGKSIYKDIQRKLDQVFAEDHPDRSSEQINNQANSFNSLHSFSSSIFSTRSTIRLDSSLRGEIKEGLDNDTRWADILMQLQSAPGQNVQQGAKEYRMAQQLLEVRQCTGTDRTWRLVIPDVPSIKQKLMQEVYSVPYAGHLGYQKTLKKLQQHFYWPDHTLEIRDFVLSCEICQQEKSVHRVPAGLLEPLTLPEQKWADVSLDFIIGLPRSTEGYDGILIVVDRATKMVHLVVVNQTITVAETALVF